MSLRTPIATCSYPQLFEAKAFQDGQTAKYSCVLVFDKAAQQTEAYASLQQALKDSLKEKFGDKAKAVYETMRNPFRPISQLANSEGAFDSDCTWIRVSSTRQPEVVHRKNGRVILKASEVYAGCKVLAAVNVYSYDKAGNKGAAFGLQALCKMDEGERLGNSIDAKEAFGDVIEDGPADDKPAASGDDW